MKATEIAAVFEQIAPVESGIASDIAEGYLGFRFGDRNTEVTGVGVAWWLDRAVVEAAAAAGLNMLILHEPQLFRHYDSPFHTNMQPMTQPQNLRKVKLLVDHGIVVYTAHSNWDLQADCGMLPTVARRLALPDPVAVDGCVGVYRPAEQSFGRLVEHVKARMGLDRVRVQGDADLPVRTLVLGFGSMGSEVEAILANNADAGIFGELREWPLLQAREAGVGIIETTHVVSESIGFASVVDEMTRRLPDVRFEFLEVPFPYRWA
jgi:putative NIF3 family GTP cyclohydrolase 1 type 2